MYGKPHNRSHMHKKTGILHKWVLRFPRHKKEFAKQELFLACVMISNLLIHLHHARIAMVQSSSKKITQDDQKSGCQPRLKVRSWSGKKIYGNRCTLIPKIPPRNPYLMGIEMLP